MTISEFAKKFSITGAVVAFIEGQNQLGDYVVYPAVILWLGVIKGGIVMTIIALFMNYLIISWYNKTTHDWFGLEWLKVQETVESSTRSGRILRRMLKMGKWPAYVGISIYEPAYGFIFLRGRQSTSINLTKTDWFWFVISNLIGNLVWILLVSGVIGAVRQLI